MTDELKQHLQFILLQLLASQSYANNTPYSESNNCIWIAIEHLSKLIPDFKPKVESDYFELWDSVKYKNEDYFVIGRDWCTDGKHYWKYLIVKEKDINYVRHDELTIKIS